MSKPSATTGANPFEQRGNKNLHFTVLGRHVKGSSRNVAEARAAAQERREHTLKKELAAAGKSNTFKDRRFGEDDPTVDDETKMLVRLQKERRRQLRQSSKKSKFNIEGGDGEGAGADMLTHFGRSLSEMQAFADGASDRRRSGGGDAFDDDDYDNDAVTGAHFGGGDGPAPAWRGQKPVPAWAAAAGAGAAPEEGAKKSYAEIMEEVIAKSKAGRAERAAEKAEQEFSLQRLDMQASAVNKLLARAERERSAAPASAAAAGAGAGAAADGDAAAATRGISSLPAKPFAPAPPSARGTALEGAAAAGVASASSSGRTIVVKPVIRGLHSDAGTNSADAAAAAAAPGARAGRGGRERDAYDALLTTLAASSRSAVARDRTKTAEEAAADEAQRLKELESLRLARMMGDSAGPAGEAGGDGAAAAAPGWSKGGVLGHEVSGDDLGPDGAAAGGLTFRQRRRQMAGASILDYAAKEGEGDEEEEEGEAEAAESSRDSSSAGSGAEEEEDEGDEDDDEEEEEDSVFGGDLSESDALSDLGDAAAGEAEAADDSDAEPAAAAPKAAAAGKPAASGRGAAAPAGGAPGDAAAAGVAGIDSMPYVLPCPTSWRQWHELVMTHCAPLAAPTAASSERMLVDGTASSSAEAADKPVADAAPLTGKKRRRTDEAAATAADDTASDGAAATAPETAAAATTGHAAARAACYELLRRIRACHALSLKAHHKAALLGLYSVLVEDVRRTGERHDPRPAGTSASTSSAGTAAPAALAPLPTWRLEAVSDHLFEMSQEKGLTIEAGEAWRELMRRMARRVGEALAAGSAGEAFTASAASGGATAPAAGAGGSAAVQPALRGSGVWLSLGEVLQARLALSLFPATDFRHAILTPLQLLLGQCLTAAPLHNETDLARGLLHAGLALDLAAPSRRYVPELAGFLQSALCVLAGVSARHGEPSAAAAGGAVPTGVCLPTFYALAAAAAAPGATGPSPLLHLALRHLAALGPSADPSALSHASRIPLSILGPACTTAAAAAAGGEAGKKQGPKAAAEAAAVRAVLPRSRVALASLLTAVSLLRRLTDVLVPPAFHGASPASTAAGGADAAEAGAAGAAAKRARRSEILTAAAAPSGDVAVGLAAAARQANRAALNPNRQAAASSSVTASAAALAATPLLTAPEVLDPCANALARIVARLPSSGSGSKKAAAAAAGAAAPNGGSGATAAPQPAPHLAWLRRQLSASLQAVVAARDAVAGDRIPLRFYESAAPPPALRAYAPLLEDIGGGAGIGASAYAGAGRTRGEEADALDAARAREEVRTLQRAKRRETRGAMRELRKDRQYVVRQTDAARAVRAGERDGKFKEVMTFLHSQQATSRQQVKKGGKVDAPQGARSKDIGAIPAAGRFTKADRRARKSGGAGGGER